MGNPEDQTLEARAAADAELARQDETAANALSASSANLTAIASQMAKQGYGDASAIVHHAAVLQGGESAARALEGEYYGDAARDWNVSAYSLEQQAREEARSFLATAESRRAHDDLNQASSDTEEAKARSAMAAADAEKAGSTAAAAAYGRVAYEVSNEASVAEEQARAVHPVSAADAVAPEPPASE